MSAPRTAYHEVKAPGQVDTLRDEACPVCGETDAWDGDECKVCGFVAPPDKFQDPDVDLHQQLDLRQDDSPGSEDVDNLNADTNDRDRDGLDDATGEPIQEEDEQGADDVQPILACPNCGYEVAAGEPVSTNTAQPEMADVGTGPADGDLCPNCGKAPLASASELAAAGMAPDEEPDADRPIDDDESEKPAPSREEDEDDPADSDQDQDTSDERPVKKKAPPWKR